jgi:uncharacterized membrane protein YfcA
MQAAFAGRRNNMVDDLFKLLAGLLAGGLGGFLGVGGGIVLMPMLRFGLGMSPAHACGTCVLAVFFTTLGGGFKHYRLGHVPVRLLLPVIISGTLSTAFFSLLFLYFARRDRWLDLGIGMVFLLLSLRMIIDGVRNPEAGKAADSASGAVVDSRSRKVALGSLAGILPGLFGIGTGAILVPGFAYLLKSPIKTAIGSALVCFAANAFISAAMKSAQGYVDYSVAIPVCLGTLVGSQIGAVVNHRAPSVLLRVLFGVVFSGVSLSFIFSAFQESR